MNNLYSIIKQLQDTQGTKAKQSILDTHKDNEELREYMKAVYDPSINYYQTKVKAAPKVPPVGTFKGYAIAQLTVEPKSFIDIVKAIVENLAGRKITGNKAVEWLSDIHYCLDEDRKKLIELLIKRSIGAGVGDTMVLKTWPDLYFVPPYMRCSLLDDKIRAKFDKQDKFAVQLKADGSFAYLLVDNFNKNYEVITRNGNHYPTEFAKELSCNLPDGVYVGELEVYERFDNNCVLLDRKTGNGILNSILQGDLTKLDDNVVFMSAWDVLSIEEFVEGYSDIPYTNRFDDLCYFAEKGARIDVIETHFVESMEEAFKIYQDFLAQGKEGAVIKTLTHKWKDGTSKECVKLKIEFEAEYVITGLYEGEGKAAGMLGGFHCESSDGRIKFSVGSGFTDEQRKLFWSNTSEWGLIGKVVTVKANDIVESKNSDSYSLFLPIFVEVRTDKNSADTYEQVKYMLKACRGG